MLTLLLSTPIEVSARVVASIAPSHVAGRPDATATWRNSTSDTLLSERLSITATACETV